MERVTELVDERRDVFLVNGIDLLPIDHHPGGFGVAHRRDYFRKETLLSIRRTVREIFNRFGLPRVPDEIRQQRHQLDSFARAKFWKANIGIDLNIAETVHDRDPFRTQMSD